MDERAKAVQRMQEYIEAHLFETITLADLARVSLFSPWYAHRLFAAWTSLTPGEYIRKLRLSRSALRLRDEKDCTVAKIALEMGFSSVDGYQRAFFREFGRNPGEYAAHPSPLYLFVPYGVTYREMGRSEKMMEKARTITVTLTSRPRRKALIKRGIRADDYFTYCDEVGCDVWGLLQSIPSLYGEPVCMWLPKKAILPGTSTYVQGVELPLGYDGVVPEGMEILDLPEAEYLMFQGEPFEEKDYQTAIGEVWDAKKRYDPSLIGYDWDDENPRIQLEPVGSRGYIEFIPVKRR